MPNTKTAAKRHRQSLLRRERNRAAKNALKTQVRKVRGLVEASDLAQSQVEFQATVKRLDQIASKGIISKNKASRLKSRLSARIKALKNKPAAPAAPAAS